MHLNDLTYRHAWPWWLAALLIVMAPAVARSAPHRQPAPITCAEAYTVQAGDWLSTLADKYLGEVLAYPALVEATHQKRAEEARFAHITDPDLIEVGWLLCIPDRATASTLLADQRTFPPAVCETLATSLAQLAQPRSVTATTVTPDAFADYDLQDDSDSTGCRISARFSNAVPSYASGYELFDETEMILERQGWKTKVGSVSTASAGSAVDAEFDKENRRCYFSLRAEVAEGVELPDDFSPLSGRASLSPEQLVYGVSLECTLIQPDLMSESR